MVGPRHAPFAGEQKVSVCGEEIEEQTPLHFPNKLLHSTLACVTGARRAFLPPIAADLLADDQIFVFTRFEIGRST